MKYFTLVLLLVMALSSREEEVIKNVGLKNIGKFSGINNDGVEFEKTYYISQYLATTPINARSACKSYGSTTMDLASFESREEFLKIRPELNIEIQKDPVVVGGFMHKSNGRSAYYWISSGLKIDFRYDESRGYKCLALQNEGAVGFIPISCNSGEYLFICQDIAIHYSN